jgi:hypothetical protein
MPGGLGPRFALEAGFLILLAAVVTYAQLETTEIILVMAGGWLVASVFEVLAARRERMYPGGLWERRAETAEEAREDRDEQQLEPSPEPAAAAEDEPVSAEPAPALPPAPRLDDEATGQIEMPKRRRWFRRSAEPEPRPDEAAARPSARHVRLIRAPAPPSDVDERKDAEAGS